jgi:hypothetical protein
MDRNQERITQERITAMKRTFWATRLIGVLALLGLLLSAPSVGQAQAQGGGSRTFAQTGKTISGAFLTYWEQHGGLAQQGYPISYEMQEKSDLNGQTYTVQYFERAVFEKHPENAPPFDVLLSQLGTFRYQAKYAQTPPIQTISNESARLFPQTGHSVGGKFLAYWEQHGGLAQQGYPISDEFQEVSPLNGQTYTVQYFERAVFELHPENQPPYDVLLSQLGTFRYNAIYVTPPTATPVPPTATPAPAANPCADIPASQNQTVTPNCGVAGTIFAVDGWGFKPGEVVGIYATSPDGAVLGAAFQKRADDDGHIKGITFRTATSSPLGIWASTMESTETHVKSIGFFRVISAKSELPPTPGSSGCSDVQASTNGSVTPQCGRVSTTFDIEMHGFTPNEKISFWVTAPNGDVVGTARPLDAGSHNGTLHDQWIGYEFAALISDPTGLWAITYQGASSAHQAVIWLKITR